MISESTKTLNYNYQLASAKEAIRITLSTSNSPVMTTKFTEDSSVLLHLVSQIQPNIPVIWIDTGYNTRATLAFAKDVQTALDLNLHTYQPIGHTITMPPTLDSQEHSDFVNEVKIAPFNRALSELNPDAWLSSIRRHQSEHRSTLSVFDSFNEQLLKVSPLLDWSSENVTRYRLDNDLPLGPACFDPTKGEPLRECGLHLDQARAS